MKKGIIQVVVFAFAITVARGQFVMPFPADLCPSGFSMHGKSCYRFINMEASWAEAWTYCSVMTSHPVAIESQEENSFLTQLVSNHSSSDGTTTDSSLNKRIWTSGTNIQGDLQWRGTNTGKVPYTSWSPGEPYMTSPDGVYCVMKFENMWFANECSHQRRFVCEKEIDGISMPMFPQHTDPPKYTDGQKTTPIINFG